MILVLPLTMKSCTQEQNNNLNNTQKLMLYAYETMTSNQVDMKYKFTEDITGEICVESSTSLINNFEHGLRLDGSSRSTEIVCLPPWNAKHIDFSVDSKYFKEGRKLLDKCIETVVMKLSKNRQVSTTSKTALGFYCYICHYSVTKQDHWSKHNASLSHRVKKGKFQHCRMLDCDCRVVIHSDMKFFIEHVRSPAHEKLRSLITEADCAPQIIQSTLPQQKMYKEVNSLGSESNDLVHQFPSCNEISFSIDSEYFKKGCEILNKFLETDVKKAFKASQVPVKNTAKFGFYCYLCEYSVTRQVLWNRHNASSDHKIKKLKYLNCKVFNCNCHLRICSDSAFYTEHVQSTAHKDLMSLINKASVASCASQLESSRIPQEIITEIDSLNSVPSQCSKDIAMNSTHFIKGCKILNKLTWTIFSIQASIKKDDIYGYYCYLCHHTSMTENWQKHNMWNSHKKKNLKFPNCTIMKCECNLVLYCDSVFYDHHIRSDGHKRLMNLFNEVPVAVSQTLHPSTASQQEVNPPNIKIHFSIDSIYFREGVKILNRLGNMVLRKLTKNPQPMRRRSVCAFYCYLCLFSVIREKNWNVHHKGLSHKTKKQEYPNCNIIKCDCLLVMCCDSAFHYEHTQSDVHRKLMSLMSVISLGNKSQTLQPFALRQDINTDDHIVHQSPLYSEKYIDFSTDSQYFKEGCNILNALVDTVVKIVLKNAKTHIKDKPELGFYCYLCQYSGAKKVREVHENYTNHILKKSKFLHCKIFHCDCHLVLYCDSTFYAEHKRSPAHENLICLVNTSD